MSLSSSAHLAAHLGTLAPFSAEADDSLVCTATWAETADVRTFVFEAPAPRLFAFKPGQFLTFEFPLPGGPVNRCYTIASSALRPHSVSITVKRVPNGPVSNWLHDHCTPGTVVKALDPMGDFTCLADPAAKYLFLSGGSGITPLMAMTRAFADLGKPIDIVFLHAARTPLDIIFRDELDLVARRLPGLRIIHLPETTGGEAGWSGPVGRISADLFKLMVPDFAERSVWCCGPAPFMKAAHAIHQASGANPALYHQESFDFAELTGASEAATADAPAATGDGVKRYKVTFTKLGQTIEVRSDEFILAAARHQGIRLSAACTEGLCGTCKSKLDSGTVDMNHKGGIRKKEIDMGLFLPCCSKPTSDLVIDK